MSVTMKISGVGDLLRQMTKIVGIATSEKNIADALRPASMVFAEYWKRAAPVSRRGVKSGNNTHSAGSLVRAIFGGRIGRGSRSGKVTVFAAVDAKKAPQGTWINKGTRRQAADPEVFGRPFRAARPIARRMAKEGIARLVAMFGSAR